MMKTYQLSAELTQAILDSVSAKNQNKTILPTKYNDGIKKVFAYKEVFDSGPEDFVLKCLLDYHKQKWGTFIPKSLEWLVNLRIYESGSDLVWWHHDGSYQDLKTTERSHSYTEAYISTCTGILCVEDLNFEETLLLMSVKTGEIKKIKLKKNRLLIFDNLNYIHAVPRLYNYKKIIGFRIINTEMCAHFTQENLPGYTEYSTDSISGYIKYPKDPVYTVRK